MKTNESTRDIVRERYGELAKAGRSCCGSSPAGVTPEAIGYTAEQVAAIPEGANLGLGCGNPLAFAAPRAGETVLDLGAGAGIDVFLAAREVGPTGRVIGVDMTPEMLSRARENARKVGADNVEFRLGEIEHLPVANASVDVITSNCVINLSPEKEQVFREAYRVLRPGGRMVVSDLVWLEPPPADLRASLEALVGCVAGASLRDDYLRLIREAGFHDVEIVAQDAYDASEACCGSPHAAHIASVKVRALR